MAVEAKVGRCQHCSESDSLLNGHCDRCARRLALQPTIHFCRFCKMPLRKLDINAGFEVCGALACLYRSAEAARFRRETPDERMRRTKTQHH